MFWIAFISSFGPFLKHQKLKTLQHGFWRERIPNSSHRIWWLSRCLVCSHMRAGLKPRPEVSKALGKLGDWYLRRNQLDIFFSAKFRFHLFFSPRTVLCLSSNSFTVGRLKGSKGFDVDPTPKAFCNHTLGRECKVNAKPEGLQHELLALVRCTHYWLFLRLSQ